MRFLFYIPQLHSFTFYICTYGKTVNLFYQVSDKNIQQTFTNIGQQHVASIVNYINTEQIVCSIFSLPLHLTLYPP